VETALRPAPSQNRLYRIAKGLRATVPVALSVVPFGIAYGAVAAQTMPTWQAVLMSLTVFAGTAQFVAASMLSQEAAYLPVLITGLLINSRLLLLSAALMPHFRSAPRRLHPLIAQLLTDESFAVSIAEFGARGGDALFFIGSGLAIFATWQASTWIGVLFGAGIPPSWGLEYALPASLIVFLFLLVRDRRSVGVAILAALVGLALQPLVSGTWSSLAATLVAATLGVGWTRWRSRS